MEIINWIKSLRGKTRWQLQYEGTGLIFKDNRCLVADVYDDYLIFNLLDANLNAKQLFMIEINTFNECSAASIKTRILEAINVD